VLAALLALRVQARRAVSDGQRADALERLGGTVEETARRLGGQVLRRDAETALVRLDGAARATRCAVALRAAAQGLGLALAQGLHVGEVEVEGGAAGAVARIAERVAAAARPGEILASALVAELAAGSGQHFAEHGEVAVEGRDRPLRMVAVTTEQHLEPARRALAMPDLGRLSQREREVLGLVAEGLSNPGIAARLSLSEHTVKRHVANILTKLDLPSRAAAAALAGQP
jgi:DNA-binding CsgD family transcriptional regulator